MEPLSDRKEQILRAVIIEYVTGAEPVPSDLIASKYELGVRSATVRSELLEMSDMGLLEQPHTSAGRVPSDQGYRYFVDQAARREGLTGWVRNRPDGAVEVQAEGDREALDRFEGQLRTGPPAARVEDIQVHEQLPTTRTDGFRVRV